MLDHKQLCKTCKVSHLPPTGKKYKLQKKHHRVESDNELLSDADIAGQVPATQTAQGAAADGDPSTAEEGDGAAGPCGGAPGK